MGLRAQFKQLKAIDFSHAPQNPNKGAGKGAGPAVLPPQPRETASATRAKEAKAGVFNSRTEWGNPARL